jgi:hypothetical protein
MEKKKKKFFFFPNFFLFTLNNSIFIKKKLNIFIKSFLIQF